jgi:tripartite-type tricarboxylate transporter receptor subunit TctC
MDHPAGVYVGQGRDIGTAESKGAHPMRFVRTGLAATIGLLMFTSAHAQVGEQPIRIIMPYPAGSVGDATARMIAESMRSSVQRAVIVENKAGAAGRLGVQAVKEGPADGSMLLFTPIAPMAVFPHVYDKLAYDPVADFTPISQVATFDLGIAVGANVPSKSLDELVAWLKKNPGQATYGSPAAGSLPHFFAVLFAQTTGIELRHVAYKGNPQAITDLIGGHLPIFFTSTQDFVETHKAGRIRVLATSGSRRSTVLPEVPTFAEAGYPIRGEGWFGIYAPAKTPPETVAQLNAAIVSAMRAPAIKNRLIALGLQPTGTSGQELAMIQKADAELWGPVIKASGFKPQ